MIRRSILLCTPPFVQSNTPYPATMYVTGLLRKNGYTAHQCDLSIKTFRAVFSALFLERAFSEAAPHIAGTFFARHRRRYCDTVEDVIRFLRGKDPALAYRIVSRNFLPEGKRFTGIEKPKSPFDTADYAKYLATLYIEDLYDFFRIYIDANFGLTRYAEKISASVKRFSVLDDHLKQKPSLIEQVTLDILDSLLEERPADALGVTIPFPGNLIPALRMCAHIRKKYPHMTTIAGGGYVSTELRQIESTDFFSLANYLVLDGGSNALMRILDGDVTPGEPVAGTIYCHDGRLVRGEEEPFVPDRRTSLFPDYDGIDPDEYVSLTDTVNPMMRLWNDGFWNKLTAAYGCYWSRCAFCDTSLDYIRTFAPLDTDALLERIRSVRKQTKQSGFHFTDEAAPPSALKKLALRLIRDGENISYWTNIRLEPAYSVGLCRLLAFSGCIAVSGGIEVASDRVLARMDKGVSVDDIIKCAFRFSQAGVMVHAYLMYAFPTETAAETVTALEIIRQLFAAGCIDSAYWHRFSLTRHSPVYEDPERFNVSVINDKADFAVNDCAYSEGNAPPHDSYGAALATATAAYMKQNGLDTPVTSWFDVPVPTPDADPDRVRRIIDEETAHSTKNVPETLFIARIPIISRSRKACTMAVQAEGENYAVPLSSAYAEALDRYFNSCSVWDTTGGCALTDTLVSCGIDPAGFYSSEAWLFLRELSLFVI